MNDQAELTAVPRVPGEEPEEPSFHAFFTAHYDRLARALFLLSGDAGEAEDLAQEAMVRVYERWPRVAAMSSPEGYLYRTAHPRSWRAWVRAERSGSLLGAGWGLVVRTRALFR